MDDLSFFGCPQKQVVKIRPTKDCLVAISEFPFFVMDVNEIEAVVFERVLFGIKNFDLAIIFKDFTTMKRINSVPMEHIEELKSYFDEIDVIYAESEAPFNWGTLLSHIRDNFEDWLEEGAWGFLLDGVEEEGEGGEEGEDESEDVDPSCSYDDEEGSEEESDFSDISDEESSEVDSQELSEEGLSWEELDKQAEEEDRKLAAKRGTV